VRDFCIRQLSSGVYALFVRFKKVKQDPRIQRPQARGDGSSEEGAAVEGGSDWSIVGDIPGHVLSPFKWYRHLMAFYPNGRIQTAPMFMDKDRRRPYLYRTALTDVRMLVGLVQPGDVNYGLHGARVGGYNASVNGNGEELTTAHGLWSSKRSSSRYDRWHDTMAASIPANMVGVESPYGEVEDDGEGRPLSASRAAPRRGRAAGRGGGRGRGAAASQLTSIDEGEDVDPMPVGWTTNDDGQYVPPSSVAAMGIGPQATLEGAWRLHRQSVRLATSTSGGTVVLPSARRSGQFAASTRSTTGLSTLGSSDDGVDGVVSVRSRDQRGERS
jgi:hypothetical protein